MIYSQTLSYTWHSESGKSRDIQQITLRVSALITMKHKITPHPKLTLVEECLFIESEDLSMKEFGFLIEAIIQDDVHLIEKELSTADVKTRNKLLNGQFKPCDNLERLGIQKDQHYFFSQCLLMRPWSIAGAYSATKTLEIFIKYGADVFQRDIHNTNILHAMANVAFLFPQQEEALVKTYKHLKSLLSIDAIRELLHMEDENGLRPIELASHVGCFGFFQALFETEGVYLTKEESQGILKVQWFDVTDYESTKPGNRRLVSPLTLATFVDTKAVSNPSCKKFFSSDLLKTWVRMKFKSNIFNLILWFLTRLVTLSLIFTYDYIGGWNDMSKTMKLSRLRRSNPLNDTFLEDYSCFVKNTALHSGKVYSVMGSSILAISILIVVVDIVELGRVLRLNQSWRLKIPTGRKKVLVNILFYRMAQFLMASTLIATFCIQYYSMYAKVSVPKIVTDMIYALCIISTVWSFLYFTQPLPFIGSFVIAVQRMLGDIFKFAILFAIFLVPFGLCFQRLVIQNAKGDCPREFANNSEIIYSIFSILFNMVNFTQMNLDSTAGIYTFHIIFIFLTSILLLNFLIANFSNSAGFVSEHAVIIHTIQNLSVVWPCEDRLASVFPCLIHMQHTKSFVYDKIKDRFYITRVQLKCKGIHSKVPWHI